MSPKHDHGHDRSHAHPNDSDSAPQAIDRPTFLTVEEAARVLRIGRTTAYALTKEWRATDGQSGLPVVNVGHKLRVPACQLEQLAGGRLRERIEPPPDHGCPETSSAARSHQPSPD
jgi:excisionase family DNA binding protein